MNILVTGGAGFIGTNLALHFAKNKKNQIWLIDNFSRAGVEKNVSYINQRLPKIKIIRADVQKTNSYLPELKKADVVVHLAGQTAVTTSIKNLALDFKANLLSSFNLLETTRKYNKNAVLIYSSTNKVYGDLSNHQIKKDKKNKRYVDVCHPQGIGEEEKIEFISPYGCSKGGTDFYFLDYCRIYGLKTVVFRQSCIYGPFQIGVEDQGWLAHFSKQFLFRKPITIFGDGYQVRDLLYVSDLIQAFDLAIEKIKKVAGKAFNIGGGVKNSYSLLQVVEMLSRLTKNKVEIKFDRPRLGDQKYFVSSNRSLKKLLGWQPDTDFKQGILSLIRWQKKFFNL